MSEMVTRPHALNMVRWAEERPNVLVLSADLTSSCEADDFREAYPDRFFSLGMAEQNMMGFASGLAREGFRPHVHTFAVFVCRRPFDQVAMSVAYPNLPVRLLGFLPGITTPGGVTHQAVDDLALMRVLPNMTVLSCGDATDVESLLDLADTVDGPVYARVLRGQVPRLFPSDEPMELGRARVLSEGEDVTILSEGICTAEAMRLTPLLKERGLRVQHLHVSTIKPFDDAAVTGALTSARHGIITIENHSIIGGLGSATAEIMAEAGVGTKLKRLGLQDVYAHGASREHLMWEYGIDAWALLRAVEDMIGTFFGIEEAELRATPPPSPAHDTSKAEGL